MNVAEQALHIYEDYLFILKEKPRIETFLAETGHTREQFSEEIRKYEDTIISIR